MSELVRHDGGKGELKGLKSRYERLYRMAAPGRRRAEPDTAVVTSW